MYKRLKYYILCAELFCPQLFSALCSLTGRRFEGSEGDGVYIIFCALLALLSTGIVYYEFIRNSIKLNFKEVFILLCLPLIILSVYYLEQCTNARARQMLMLFIIWGIPSISIGVYLGKTRNLRRLKMPLILFALIIILGLVKSWLFGISETLIRKSESGESYQAAAYSASICYGIFLYFCLFKNDIPHGASKYRLIAIPLMMTCLIVILIAGGRGGMVLAIAYSCIYLYLYQKRFYIPVAKKINTIFFIIIGIAIFVYYVNNDPVLSETSQRVFSYISDGGIDMSKTSHRDEAYSRALNNWNKSPIIGYGIFKYFDVNNNYPHNFFLELLLQGGIVFLGLYVLILGLYIWKLVNIMKFEENNVFLIILLYPAINLMFSGTYLGSADFWFSLAYVACYCTHKYRQNRAVIAYEKKYIARC